MAKAYTHLSVCDDPPRKHTLLLSCMDTRLLDDTVAFMNSLNLQNRYDHLILAGSAMGARLLASPVDESGTSLPWKSVFFHHLKEAINKLHREIKDIFLLEHLDCGAYKKLHPEKAKEYEATKDLAKLEMFHRIEANLFIPEIEAFCKKQEKNPDKLKDFDPDWWREIRVRCFLMDLVGRVKQI